MAIAVGYQLDKFELVYSTRGVATGVSYTDAHAQFLAFDVLTGLSAIAGGVPRRRRVHAGDVAAGADDRGLVDRRDRHRPDLPRDRPGHLGRAERADAPEAPYISNNIAMTRLAFDLDGWDVRDYTRRGSR